MLLEQLFSAELYAWHLVWKRKKESLPKDEAEGLALQDVQRPSILRDIPALTGSAGEPKDRFQHGEYSEPPS